MENTQRKIVFIGLVWPEPASSAAGIRILQLIHIFVEQGWQVTFASAAQASDFSADLSALGIDCLPVALNSDSFDVLLANINPEIVLFDRYIIEEQFGWRVARACPKAIRILDTEDLHCLRSARTKMYKKGKLFVAADLLTDEIAKREIACIYRCDLSLMISEAEVQILIREFKIDSALLWYLPLFAERSSDYERLSFEQRSGFIFIGNFLHEPNVDAVITLKNHIWPSIRRKLPDASIAIYGAYPSSRILQLNNSKDRFYSLGRAENALSVLSGAKVLLAPLNFGAGLKGKLLEAMQVGTPSVTTSIGAEGINAEMPWAGAVADNYDDFASEAVSLWTDSDKWEAAQRNGYEILDKRFNRSQFIDVFIIRLDTLRESLQQHRNSNFIGAMLMHHTASSTKYMSMWIEEKNRLK